MTALAPGSAEWRWVDIGGQQHRLRFEELAQALSRGHLPPYTLVWRTGWLEWLPAAHVPDLSGAIGVRRAAAPILARTDFGAIAPPSPPLAHYATHVPRGTLTLERSDAPAAPARPPSRTRPGMPVPSDPPPIVGPPVPVRNVMPTLSGDGAPTRSNTLRPTGAIPPPPRNVLPSPKRPPFSSIPPVEPKPGAPHPSPPPRTPVPPAAKTVEPSSNGAPPRAMPNNPPLRPGPPLPQVPPIRIPSAAPAPREAGMARSSRGAEPPTTPPRNAPVGARGTSSAPPPPSSRRKAAAEAAKRAAGAQPPAASATGSPAQKEPVAEPQLEAAKALRPEDEQTDTRIAEAQVPPRAFETAHLPSVIVTPVPPPPEEMSAPEPEPPTPRAPQKLAPAASFDAADAPTQVPTRRLRARSADDVQVAGLSRRTITMLSSAGVLIPGVVLLIVALLNPRHRAPEPTVAEASASAAATIAAPAPAPGCFVEKSALRLAESAYLAVPALMATAPDGNLAAVGLAATKERAIGLTIDPVTLIANSVFEQTVSGSTTLSVVPLVRSGTLEFVVDRADANRSSARTVDAAKRFTIAVTGDAVSRIVGSTTDVIWPRSAQGSAMTTPRIAPITGGGYAVTFREGGQEGNVLIGFVHEDGSKLTELSAIKAEAALVGTPAVGASGDGVLVAFAAKAKAEDPWHLELAAGKSPEAPTEAHAFALPPGGPGGEAISPAVEGLGDGRFLLQWTEGSAGNRAVRAQLVTADLVCIGDPVTLSSADQNAGQGTLWLKGKRALALFLVKKDASHELWGASLRCQ